VYAAHGSCSAGQDWQLLLKPGSDQHSKDTVTYMFELFVMSIRAELAFFELVMRSIIQADVSKDILCQLGIVDGG
jgi:hypothetical protein